MEQWTIAEPFEGRYRPFINYGGKPYWCMFDFAVRHTAECNGVEIELTPDADDTSVEWFPHLRQGMLRGLTAAKERGREWTGIRIEIRKIHSHPIDTTANACDRYGFGFVLSKLPRHGQRV